MFGNSKEYQDIKKLYEEKVSKPENINEITGGLGPIPNANSNNNVKVSNTNNNNAPKTGKNIFQKIGDILKTKPITGSRSRFNRNNNNEVKKMSNIPKDEGNAVINGKPINPNFGKPGGATTDTSSEIESSASEFKANEGEKVNQRFKKDVQIVRNSQMTGKQRAQEMAKKRIAAKEAGTYQKPKTAQELAKERIAAKEAGTYQKPKTAQELAKERIAAKQRLKDIKVENYTPYDMVLEYLMSTQQVATIEEANYVMTEMDAKTIQSIVEEQKKNLNEIRGLGKLTLGQIGSTALKGALGFGAYKLAFGGKGNNTNTNPNTKIDTSNITVDKKKKGNFLTNFINKKRDESPLGGNKRVNDTRNNSGDERVGEKIYFK